ncbi:glutamine-hydrolyzing carbamoyl-phosphate synthase small subunit [Haliangium sp.]|uniref:glutamine-hydrolyzing carbamoyl-phosphate synthase small subunit n=1 Tax=Haliangium sp. TaxID=2663208 RepID=UPI003D1013C7
MSATTAATPAVLVLESGRVFAGTALGAPGRRFGEAVFNTSMTGYQEILTDPSYAGQIVVMTASHIGNTGVNDEDVEARRMFCAGLAVREAAGAASSWRARASLDDYLREHGVPAITGVDTRALTRALRTGGAQRAVIASGVDPARDPDAVADLVAAVRAAPVMEGRDLASEVTCEAPYTWPPRPGSKSSENIAAAEAMHLTHGWQPPAGGLPTSCAAPDRHVVAYDFGIKRSILRSLYRIGCRVTVVPAHTPAEEALALAPDGLFLSNGPGDPAAVSYAVDTVRRLVDSGRPVFGICLGHQILALALGARTYKLPFGHHGGNHPVVELATGQVAITAQNHGFAVAVDSLPEGVACTHENLYDHTVEGIELRGRPVFGVQYHPEASPGPHDAFELFDRFAALIGEGA